MADYETITVDKADGVAWVTLNRPAVRNAINQQMQTELHEVWHGFRYDDDVHGGRELPGVPDAVDVRRSRS